jgi:hypothetical protein
VLLANRAPARVGQSLVGDYWCTIDESSYEYPRFPCVIAPRGGRLVLEKLGGSVRFRGAVTPDGRGGFAFVGEQYCPWGDCTEPVRATFAPGEPGELRGNLNDHMVVHLTSTMPGSFVAYGGVGYGGQGYGGASYGGASYGGLPLPAP